MAKLTLTGSGNPQQIASTLISEIQGSGLSCQLVDSAARTVGDSTVYMLVFEKYFMRASNRASLSVMVSGNSRGVAVDAIGSGGGQGALFSFSWGAEDSFVNLVGEILRPLGFR